MINRCPLSTDRRNDKQQKENNIMICKKRLCTAVLKGIAPAAVIAAGFFVLNGRSPEKGDVSGMAALAAVCVAGSYGGLMSDRTAAELSADDKGS